MVRAKKWGGGGTTAPKAGNQVLLVNEKVGYSAAVEEGRQGTGLYPPPVKTGRSQRIPIVVDDRLKSSGRP